MKLHIVQMVGALALQFTAAPHWVGFTYTSADGSTVVRFQSGQLPEITTTTGKVDGKKITTIQVVVPSNGGLRKVFGCELNNNDEAAAVGTSVKEALAAYEESLKADNGPKIL